MKLKFGVRYAAICFSLACGIMFGQVRAKATEPRTLPPQFDDFRVPTPIPARKDELVYVANHVPDFEKELLEAAKGGPNFAGHFVVEQWTCGSSCTRFAVVDFDTKMIHSMSFSVSYLCPTNKTGKALTVRLDSRLLIVNGAMETIN